MIKTIQYLAEADSSRVLVALDLKAAFPRLKQDAANADLAAEALLLEEEQEAQQAAKKRAKRKKR